MNLTQACQALQVSRSGYHAHLRKCQRPRRIQDASLAAEIHTCFDASRRTYGSPRLVRCLRARGLRHGKNRIARLMREQGLRVRQKRRFLPRTTVADPGVVPASNHLLARPAPDKPNQVWVSDITYLPTGEGWLYLAAEMDLCSRRILGWQTGESLATTLPASALDNALRSRGRHPGKDLLHHSDQGCQYASAVFRRRLHLHGITQSMSRRGNCYDNAAMESFWATLKTECFASTVPATRAQARSMVFDYIETFYNPVRLHSSLDFLSPVAFELSFLNN
ncbi:transposase [Brevifollis gellanilyticus]|uniref:Transposase n=2 Tax=Brevifollis gellanilyticus TaxID=748831 RepID=A0A512MIB1_9BACT|nr:transposase [Brevifollis gellanilyticus]